MPTTTLSETRAREIATKYAAGERSDLAALEELARGDAFEPLAVVAEADALRAEVPGQGNWADGATRGELYYLHLFGSERIGELHHRGFHLVAREDVTTALEAGRLEQELLYPEFEWPAIGFGFGVRLTQWEAMVFGAELATAVANRKAIEQKIGDAFDDSKTIRERIRYAEPVFSKSSGQSRRAVLVFPRCILVDNPEHATI